MSAASSKSRLQKICAGIVFAILVHLRRTSHNGKLTGVLHGHGLSVARSHGLPLTGLIAAGSTCVRDAFGSLIIPAQIERTDTPNPAGEAQGATPRARALCSLL